MPGSKGHCRTFYRHRLPMRLTHWVSALCLFILLLSGLQIFNAHPYLYWGSASDFDAPWLAIDARTNDPSSIEGQVRLYGHSLKTTGVLGLSGGEAGNLPVAFTSWPLPA